MMRARAGVAEMARYVVNGLLATAVHFCALTVAIDIVHEPGAGLASLAASLFGITASFLGNRYFVFAGDYEPAARQLARFTLLYAAIAVLHGSVLALWTDVGRLDYRWGFLLATALQVVLGYVGNKRLVFRAARAQRS